MKRNQILSAGILLTGVALWTVCGSAWAQTWRQDAWQDGAAAADSSADGTAAPATGWQPKGGRPTQPLKQATADQWVGPDQTVESTYSDPSATRAMSSAAPSGRTRTRAKWVTDREVIEPGTPQFETLTPEAAFSGNTGGKGGGCSHCGADGEECDSCDQCGEADCGRCGKSCDFGYELFNGQCCHLFRDLSVFVGGDAFKGPLDYGRNGNFGLNQGLNLAGPLGDPWGCGYQIGANVVESDFSGSPSFTIGDYNFSSGAPTAVFRHGRHFPPRRLLHKVPMGRGVRLPPRQLL